MTDTRKRSDDTRAPDPDDERKPDSPPEVSKRSWKYVLRKTLREFIHDECPDRAGALTYYGVLALFPGLLALASLLALVGQGRQAVDAVFIALLYYATPNAKQPKFRWISLGAVVAIVMLVIVSAGFALYVANLSNYDRTYGSFAGVIVFLLWLWLANCALLFGAEFDAELERGRQLQAGIEAEEDIQLPPRDTRKSDKAAKQEEKDVELGRRIRLEHADEDDDQSDDESDAGLRRGRA